MGQENYLLRTGVGFDVDRRSGQQAVGFIETIADTMNTTMMKKSVDGINARNGELKKLNKDLEENQKNATKKRQADVERSARTTHQTVMAALPEPPAIKRKKSGALRKDYAEYLGHLNGMEAAHKKFADRAAAAGIKMKRSMTTEQGKPIGVDSIEFAKQDAEARKRQINLMDQMIKENTKLHKSKKKGAAQAERDNKHLIADMDRLISLDKDAIQLEREEAKTKRKNVNQYKKDARNLHKQNKQELQNIKTRTIAYKKMGQQAKSYAQGITSGMKNMFIIGTAAAAAFAYKLAPVAQQVMEFEKTIINANSVFRESNEVLHQVSDSLVQFGLEYGIGTEKSAEGLYQLASAGLDAAESQEVLTHTLKLAMATQGDHNTLAKLTVQTIMGFGMEMTDAEMLTDKFAHTIQKSLVEWQDLASSVKFAMPFFTATGQSIDALLGGIEVLSNRALEAGIAGRGLRQALAQLTKHANDNASAFAKLGVETMDAEGNMRPLVDIVNDAKSAFGDVSDLEALTAMLEDMNVRGATAFALLVQNADEYTAAVKDLSNSAGEATAMADVQQQSLENQIQRVKNALMAPFLFSDKIGEANGTLNEFTLRIKEIVDEFVQFFIVGEKGEEQVTKFGYQIRDFVIEVMRNLLDVVRELKKVFLEQEAGLDTFTNLLTLATKPLMIMLKILNKLGPNMLNYIVYYKVISKLLPINTIISIANTRAQLALAFATAKANSVKMTFLGALIGETAAVAINTAVKELAITVEWLMYYATWAEVGATMASAAAWTAKWAAATGGITAFLMVMNSLKDALTPLGMLTVALIAGAAAWLAFWMFASGPAAPVTGALQIMGLVTGVAALTALMVGFGLQAANIMTKPKTGGGGGSMATPDADIMDTGGVFTPRYYDGGGVTDEHGMAVLQKGETVISKTQNMLDGGASGGITIQISGDVYDGDNFADKISEVLPQALSTTADTGSMSGQTTKMGTSFGKTAISRGI